MNPEKAVDAILEGDRAAGLLTVRPLTIARYALLEKIKSPILTGEGDMLGVAESIYVMCAPVDRLAGKSPETIKADALEWADELPLGALDQAVKAVQDSLSDMAYLAPDGKDDGKKKPRATAG